MLVFLCGVQWAICTAVDDRAATCTFLVDAGQSGISLVDSLSPRHTHEFTAYLEHTVDGTRAGTVTATFTVTEQFGESSVTNEGGAEKVTYIDSILKSEALASASEVEVTGTANRYVFGQEPFPCYGLDFDILSLKVPLVNEQSLPFEFPMNNLLHYEALQGELLPQFTDVCQVVNEKLHSVERCAYDMFNQTSHMVSSLCSEAFPDGPPSKPPLYITLGTNCAAPAALRAARVRQFASPFDWTLTPMESALSVLLGETSSLTTSIRYSDASDIDPEYQPPDNLTTEFYIGVPYSDDLKVLFVHEDSFDKLVIKNERRLKRMMSQIHNPPDEGVVLVYHDAKAFPLLEWPSDTRTASAIQGIHEFADKHSNIKATSLVDILPDLSFWCFDSFEQQKQLSSTLIVRQFHGSTVLDGQTKHEAVRSKVNELASLADLSCDWLKTTKADYLNAITRHGSSYIASSVLRRIFEV